MNLHRTTHHPRRRGFTLAETLIAMTLLGLTGVALVVFLRQSLKMYYMDRARTMVNRDIRSFTGELDTDAVTSNFFRIYPSFTNRSTNGVDASVNDGQVGDFLVLVYTDPAQSSTGVSVVTRLVGYYREVTDTTTNTGPVHRFDVTVNSVDLTTNTLLSILNTYVTGSASSYPIVTQLAQGLAVNANNATTTTPALFYNWVNRSIVVNAQISESLSEFGTTSQTGSTYNFTVSPRG